MQPPRLANCYDGLLRTGVPQGASEQSLPNLIKIAMDQPTHSRRESGSDTILRSRLLPRVSFQSMMVLTTICAIVVAIAYTADQGGNYASATAVGLCFVIGMILCSALVFLFAWAVSFLPRIIGGGLIVGGLVMLVCRLIGLQLGSMRLFQETIWLLNFQILGCFLLFFPFGRGGQAATENPFAADQLPPQILAPREPTI